MTGGGAGGRQFIWTGGGGGSWNDAADWRDTTLGAAASVAPGSLDTVSIVGGVSPLIVTGTGASAHVATYRSVLLDGGFQFGSLDAEGTLSVMGPGSRLSLGGLGEAGAAVASRIVVAGATLSVSGGSVLGAASAQAGALVQLGANAVMSAGLSVDGSSCVEVGSGGSFWPSWVKVFANGTLSGSGTVAANALVQGTVLSSGMVFEGMLEGVGQVRLDAAGATVGDVAAGLNLVFAAPGACLSITPGSVMAGTLVGLATGDAIDLLGQVATGASVSGGALVVSGAGGAILGRFPLAGDPAPYQAARWLVVPDGSGGTDIVELAPAASAPVSPGNATPHRDVWTGGSGGSWNSAADWRDATLGQVASVAPGSLDTVSIVGGVSPLVVTGTGASAHVATYRSVLLDGGFQFGSLDAEGTLSVMGPGSRLSLGGLGEAGAAVASRIVVAGATLSVSGGSVLGAASAQSGALVQLGTNAVMSAGLSVDGSSCVEVGSGGSFWPSWVKVFANGTLSGSGTVAANVLVQGTVLSSGMVFEGMLEGRGSGPVGRGRGHGRRRGGRAEPGVRGPGRVPLRHARFGDGRHAGGARHRRRDRPARASGDGGQCLRRRAGGERGGRRHSRPVPAGRGSRAVSGGALARGAGRVGRDGHRGAGHGRLRPGRSRQRDAAPGCLDRRQRRVLEQCRGLAGHDSGRGGVGGAGVSGHRLDRGRGLAPGGDRDGRFGACGDLPLGAAGRGVPVRQPRCRGHAVGDGFGQPAELGRVGRGRGGGGLADRGGRGHAVGVRRLGAGRWRRRSRVPWCSSARTR